MPKNISAVSAGIPGADDCGFLGWGNPQSMNRLVMSV